MECRLNFLTMLVKIIWGGRLIFVGAPIKMHRILFLWDLFHLTGFMQPGEGWANVNLARP